jgi:hypothetical protein
VWAPYRVIEDVGNSSSRMSRAAAALRCSRKKFLLASSVVGAACATRGRGRGVSGVRSACCVRTGRSPKCRAGGRVRRGRAGGRQQADGARRARLVANVRKYLYLYHFNTLTLKYLTCDFDGVDYCTVCIMYDI